MDHETRFLDLGDAVSGRRRIAWLQTPGAAAGRPGVIWLPGFKSDMASTKASALEAWALQTGTALTRFDYSGHGRSEGTIEEGTISAWLEEALAVLDRLTQGPQILIGSSMGGWIAALMQRKLRCRMAPNDETRLAGLVLIAPAWDMTERLMEPQLTQEAWAAITTQGVWYRPSAYGDGGYPITQRLLRDGEEHCIGGTHPFRSTCPIRILHGEQDPDVPFDGSLELMDLYAGSDIQLWPVPDGDHRLSRPQDITRLIEAIEQVMGLFRTKRETHGGQ